MPLGQVHRGLRCTVRSVIQGTTISTFSAEVRDVVDGAPGGDGARILVHLSGPAVDATGIGPGFSGSPIACPGAHGVTRVIGAISEGVGAYGGLDALATPIEQVLGQPVRPPPGADRDRALLRRAHALSELTVTGLPSRLAALVRRQAARMGRRILTSPAAPAARRFAVQDLRPGASVAVGESSGDISTGAVGTVTYRDGSNVWAFGHPFDGAGRRSLFLQDAYVYGVIGNPSAGEGSTYKLAAPGHDLGTLSGDGPNAIAGRIGPLPPHVPVGITARDSDTGALTRTETQVADETALGNPTGASALALVSGLGTAAVGSGALRGGSPSDQSGSMCLALTLREHPAPIRLCERYVTSAAEGLGGPVGVSAAQDVSTVVALVESPTLAVLHPTGLKVSITVRRGRAEAFLRSARLPRRVRPGQLVRVHLRLVRYHGGGETRSFRFRIPARLAPGRHRLLLAGAPAVDGGDGSSVVQEILSGGASTQGPESVGAVVAAIRALRRYDGIVAELAPAKGGRGARPVATLSDPRERLTGRLSLRFTVAKR